MSTRSSRSKSSTCRCGICSPSSSRPEDERTGAVSDGGRMLKTFRRGGQVASAFIWMGYKEMLAYPLGFFITQISAVVSTLVYYFIAQLVHSGPNVGGDYYSFVVIGIVA